MDKNEPGRSHHFSGNAVLRELPGGMKKKSPLEPERDKKQREHLERQRNKFKKEYDELKESKESMDELYREMLEDGEKLRKMRENLVMMLFGNEGHGPVPADADADGECTPIASSDCDSDGPDWEERWNGMDTEEINVSDVEQEAKKE